MISASTSRRFSIGIDDQSIALSTIQPIFSGIASGVTWPAASSVLEIASPIDGAFGNTEPTSRTGVAASASEIIVSRLA